MLPALAALHDALRPELDAGPESSPPFTTSSSSSARRDRNLRAEAATNAWAFALANGRSHCSSVSARSSKTGVCREASPRTRGARCGRQRRARLRVAGGRRRRVRPAGAWPVLVDEFVDHLRGGVSVPNESQSFSSQSLSQSSPQSEERWRVTGGRVATAIPGFRRPTRGTRRWTRARASTPRCTRAGARAGRGRASGGTTARGRAGGGGSLTGVGAAANPSGGGDVAGRSGAGAAAEHRLTSRRGCGRGVQAPPERGAGDGWARYAAGEAGARGVSRVRRPGRRRARSVDVDVPGYPAARLRRAEPGHGVADAKFARGASGAPRDVDDAKQATRA